MLTDFLTSAHRRHGSYVTQRPSYYLLSMTHKYLLNKYYAKAMLFLVSTYVDIDEIIDIHD